MRAGLLSRGLRSHQPILSAHPLNAGLTGWWLSLPHLTGTSRLVDLLGQYPGTLNGTPTWHGSRGRPGGYANLRYDGSDDYVNCSTVPGSTTWSYACWVCPTLVDGAWHHFIGHQDENTSRNVVFTISAGYLATTNHYGVFIRSSGDVAVESASVAVANTWAHLLATSSGSGGTLSLYVNGVLEDSASSVTPENGTRYFTLGNCYTILGGGAVAGEYFQGYLDDVNVWIGRCLSASDARRLYDESRLGYPHRLARLRWPITSSAAAAFDPVNFPWMPSPAPMERPSRIIAF